MTNYFKVIYKDPTRNLNNITRYSGVFCLKPETDGYHAIDMMSICMKIADILYEKLDVKLDRRDLVYRCFIHDLDELASSGDIQRGFKYHNERIRSAIEDTTREILNDMYPEDIRTDIITAKDPSTLEGLVVKMADTMQASLKIYEEHKLGNFHFESIIREHSGFLDNLLDSIKKSELFDNNEDKEILDVLERIINDFIKTIKSEINRIRN